MVSCKLALPLKMIMADVCWSQLIFHLSSPQASILYLYNIFLFHIKYL